MCSRKQGHFGYCCWRFTERLINYEVHATCARGNFDGIKPFEMFTISAIFANSIVLAMYDTPTDVSTPLNESLDVAGMVLTLVFTVEMIIRIINMGFFVDKGSYLRDAWNWLDFIVVLAGFSDFIPNYDNQFGILRVARLMRPLRTITTIKGMRILVGTLLEVDTLKNIGNVMFLTSFLYIVFGIIGTELFSGALRGVCFDADTLEPTEDMPVGSTGICNPGSGGRSCLPGQICSRTDPITGEPNSSPAYDLVSFDDFPHSVLTIFVMLTLEGWTDVMYAVQDGVSVWAWVYFVLLVTIGVFIVINLFLAVISAGYEAQVEAEDEERKLDEEAAEYLKMLMRALREILTGQPANAADNSQLFGMDTSHSEGSANCLDPAGIETSLVEPIAVDSTIRPVEDVEQLRVRPEVVQFGLLFTEEAQRRIINRAPPGEGNQPGCICDDAFRLGLHLLQLGADARRDSVYTRKDTSLTGALQHAMKMRAFFSKKPIAELLSVLDDRGLRDEYEAAELEHQLELQEKSPDELPDMDTEEDRETAMTERIIEVILANPDAERTTEGIKLELKKAGDKELLGALSRDTTDEMEKDWQDDMLGRMLKQIDQNKEVLNHNKLDVNTGLKVQRHVGVAKFIDHFIVEEEEDKVTTYPKILCSRHTKHDHFIVGPENSDEDLHVPPLLVFRYSVQWLVESPAFGHIVTALVLINCAVLASDHYGIEQSTADVLEAINLTCTIAFAVEMILKLIGIGFKRYAEDHFNLFDGFLVLASVFELFLGDDAGGISVFRALRIFRIIKLTSSLDNFKKVIKTIMSVLPEIGNFSMLMALFIFFYATMGMHLFGGKFLDTEEEPRSHFDDFGWSVVTVFQILTGENWNTVMYDAIHNEGAVAAIYFVTLMVIGGYMTLNLFLAVLLLKTMDAFNPKPLQLRVHYFINRMKQPDVYVDPTATEDDEVYVLAGRSLFIFDHNNGMRKYLRGLISTPQFKNIIMASIMISSLCLAVEEPAVSNGSCCETLYEVLKTLDIFFTAVFTVEMLIKIFCLGLCCESEHAYLRNSWNVLDAIIVVLSIVSLLLSGSGFNWVRTFRVFRALRPLRVIQRIPELRIVVNSLFKSLPTLANVMLVLGIFWMIFGILFVQLYKGKFWFCSIDGEQSGIFSITDCTGSFVTEGGDLVELAWTKPPFTFDNIGDSIVTLFEVSTLEMWLDIMYMSIDATGQGTEPEEWNSPLAAIFYVVFIVLGSFFLLQLLTGAIVTEYNKLNDEAGGKAFQSERQKRMIAKMVLVHKSEVSEPRYEWQARMQSSFTKTETFQNVVAAMIVLNIVAMALVHDGQSKEYGDLLDSLNAVFTVFFALESAVKIAAEGKNYFRSGWNLYDLVVVVVTLGELIYTIIEGGDAAEIPGAAVLRIFRIARVFRLFVRFDRLMVLVHTIVFALPTFVNVGGLLLLIFFIYAVLGMHLLGTIKRGEMLNDYANFESFGLSLLTVYRMATGESWNGIMYDCKIQPPDCDDSLDECGKPLVAVLYFVSFQLIGQFIMLNLFVAVVLENFHTTNEKRETSVTPDMFTEFTDVWTGLVGLDEAMADTASGGKQKPYRLLPVELFDELMDRLPGRLGWNVEQRENKPYNESGDRKYPKQEELKMHFSGLPTRSFKVLVDRSRLPSKGCGSQPTKPAIELLLGVDVPPAFQTAHLKLVSDPGNLRAVDGFYITDPTSADPTMFVKLGAVEPTRVHYTWGKHCRKLDQYTRPVGPLIDCTGYRCAPKSTRYHRVAECSPVTSDIIPPPLPPPSMALLGADCRVQ